MVNDSLVYCFTQNQTKNITKEIVNSKQCMVNDSLYGVQSVLTDSVMSSLRYNSLLKDTLLLNCNLATENQKEIVSLLEQDNTTKEAEIKKRDKKIKVLKIERIAYPAILGIIMLYFISLKYVLSTGV